MVHLGQVKDQFYALTRMATADGFLIKFKYLNHVYTMELIKTSETPPAVNRPGRRPKEPVVVKINTCPDCGNLMVGKICMSKKCPSNIKRYQGIHPNKPTA